jgi:hypothetical protein
LTDELFRVARSTSGGIPLAVIVFLKKLQMRRTRSRLSFGGGGQWRAVRFDGCLAATDYDA